MTHHLQPLPHLEFEDDEYDENWEEVEERLRGILEEKLAQLRVRRGKPPREQEPDPPAEPKPAESEDLGERLKRTGPEV